MAANNVAERIQNNILQHGFPDQENLFAIPPVVRANLYDGHGGTGAFVLIGYFGQDPVYRTTHTLAHYLEGNKPGELRIHWPPLFPNIWIPVCDLMQLDVTVHRQSSSSSMPTVEDDDDSDEHQEEVEWEWEENDYEANGEEEEYDEEPSEWEWEWDWEEEQEEEEEDEVEGGEEAEEAEEAEEDEEDEVEGGEEEEDIMLFHNETSDGYNEHTNIDDDIIEEWVNISGTEEWVDVVVD
ncbi:unnamed protein product [Adineta steineri]|uniref:Uncharacterized protein n=2 Tax=Adineta steineri TaxID=433720 RepID=A0A819E976_9BILA|nr:unnamed protein product [Adineta steineri]